MRTTRAVAVGLFGMASAFALLHTVGVVAFAVFPPTEESAPPFLGGFVVVALAVFVGFFAYCIGDEVLRRTEDR